MASTHKYNFEYYSIGRKIRVTSATANKLVYHAQHPRFKADLTIRAGGGGDGGKNDDTLGPVLAIVKFRFSCDFSIGLGNPDEGEQNMVWEDVKVQGKRWKYSEYGFSVGSGPGEEMNIWKWKRVRLLDWKLTDERGETRGRYLNEGMKDWLRKGTYEFSEDMTRGEEVIAMSAIMGIISKARRR